MTSGASVRFACLVVVSALAVLLLFDLAVYLLYGRTATISHGVWQLSLRYRMLPLTFASAASFLTGFLSCHFFGFD